MMRSEYELGNRVPNMEFGHIEVNGKDAETEASFAAKEREGLDFAQWAERLERYFSALERLTSPRNQDCRRWGDLAAWHQCDAGILAQRTSNS